MPPARRLVLPGLFVAALFAVVWWRQTGPDPGRQEWMLRGATMGTVYTVKGVASDGAVAAPVGLAERIRNVLDEVNLSMSTYLDDSEISAFNRHDDSPFAASPALVEVASEAQRIATLSNGAFDATVGPLVDAWGFGPPGAEEAPNDEVVAGILEHVGYENLVVDLNHWLLIKALPELRLDLSAIAKGYAVDRVAATLGAAGVHEFMVEIGGEVATRGCNGRGEIWRIGIERPNDEGRAVQTVVPLDDAALATSGDYRNFVIQDGVRFSHTIDPRIGRPIAHNLASVSVVHPSCMTADALATALEVLGPDEGLELADRLDLAALFLVREGDDRYREIRSRVWSERFENIQAPGDVVH